MAQNERGNGINAGGDEVQRVNGLFAGKAVEDRAREDRHNDLRQREGRNVDGVEQVRAGVVQHKKAQGKAGHRVAQHRDHAAKRDDGKIPRPELGLRLRRGRENVVHKNGILL